MARTQRSPTGTRGTSGQRQTAAGVGTQTQTQLQPFIYNNMFGTLPVLIDTAQKLTSELTQLYARTQFAAQMLAIGQDIAAPPNPRLPQQQSIQNLQPSAGSGASGAEQLSNQPVQPAGAGSGTGTGDDLTVDQMILAIMNEYPAGFTKQEILERLVKQYGANREKKIRMNSVVRALNLHHDQGRIWATDKGTAGARWYAPNVRHPVNATTGVQQQQPTQQQLANA